MARNITIRFTGGPQNGAILYYPYTRDIDAIVARYAQPLVGHYEVVRKSDSGFVIDVRWNDGSTGKQLPKEAAPEREPMNKQAWLLSAEAIEWRKSLDRAVNSGEMSAAVRDAVLDPGQEVPLECTAPPNPLLGKMYKMGMADGIHEAMKLINGILPNHDEKKFEILHLMRELYLAAKERS